MNLNKFNIYKNVIYCYIASGLLLFAGLIIGILFGLNTSLAINGHTYLFTVLPVIIFCIIAFIYFIIKKDGYMAFTTVLAIVHNVLLLTALVSLFRIPVTESYSMAVCFVCALTVIYSIILFNDVKDEDRKTTDRQVMVNNKVGLKFKTLVLISAILIATTLLMFFTFEASLVALVRPLLLGIIIVFYSSVFMVLPFWGRFVKERKVRKPEKIEQDYVK